MNYQPFLIGNKLRIVAPQTQGATDERIDLVMDRGAFGSGEHETTRSCLECLENLPLSSADKVLDLGSGTGILSIAALQLGAGQAWCVDIEENAVDSCQRNMAHNRIAAERVQHVCGTLEAVGETGFDLILANIYGDILLQVALHLAGKARPGARLLLSGILWEYNFDVRNSYERCGCKVVKNRLLDEFSTILLEKVG